MSSRWSIAGLMGVVLLAAFSMAALRSGSQVWAGATFLVTCAFLGLGGVGVVCAGAGARAWWLGFTTFGSGYMAWAFLAPYGTFGATRMMTLEVLKAGEFCLGAQAPKPVHLFWEIAHCLWSLVFAALGGMLARFLFPPLAAPGGPVLGCSLASRPARSSRRMRTAGGLLGIGLFASAAVAGSRTDPGLWAGATVMVTWGLLALGAVGAIFDRGPCRMSWMGATLFGAGYLAIVSGHSPALSWPQYASDRLLSSVGSWLPSVPKEYPPSTDAIAAANLRIMEALDRTVPMRFPEETPIEEVVKYVVEATRAKDGRAVPVDIDPIALQEVEKTPQSPVRLDLDGLPLRATLRLALDQLDLRYLVRDGLLLITSQTGEGDSDVEPVYDDPFLLTGRCILALLAAGLGFASAPLVSG